MPAYDKVGGSLYLRQQPFVKVAGTAYPVLRAYVKVGGSLYEYFSSIGMVQDWRITRSTTSTTSYRWNLSYRHFYVIPGVPAVPPVPGQTVYSSQITWISNLLYTGQDDAQNAANAYTPPAPSTPYTNTEVLSRTTVHQPGGNFKAQVVYRYFYTTAGTPGTPGTPAQTVYSGTSSASGSSGSQSGANTALANARAEAIASRPALYTNTDFTVSTVTQLSGTRFVYRARWTALSGDFTQYRIERDGSSDIVLTNTATTSYYFGSSNPRARIRAENTNYSPAIVGPWSDWDQY